MSSYDNFIYDGADEIFHYHIINGLSQPYPRELNIVKNYLLKYPNRNNTYLDIGGHIGTTALPYSKLYKNVITYEPNIDSYNYLIKNIQNNKCANIIAKNVGVFNKTMKAKIFRHGTNSGCYYIKESNDIDAFNVIKIDEENIENKVDFIKIDTEGSELYVLQGAKNIIKRDSPLIQVETNNCSNKFFNYDKTEIFDFMEEMNYKILDNNGNDPLFYYDN